MLPSRGASMNMWMFLCQKIFLNSSGFTLASQATNQMCLVVLAWLTTASNQSSCPRRPVPETHHNKKKSMPPLTVTLNQEVRMANTFGRFWDRRRRSGLVHRKKWVKYRPSMACRVEDDVERTWYLLIHFLPVHYAEPFNGETPHRLGMSRHLTACPSKKKFVLMLDPTVSHHFHLFRISLFFQSSEAANEMRRSSSSYLSKYPLFPRLRLFWYTHCLFGCKSTPMRISD